MIQNFAGYRISGKFCSGPANLNVPGPNLKFSPFNIFPEALFTTSVFPWKKRNEFYTAWILYVSGAQRIVVRGRLNSIEKICYPLFNIFSLFFYFISYFIYFLGSGFHDTGPSYMLWSRAADLDLNPSDHFFLVVKDPDTTYMIFFFFLAKEGNTFL